jgi:hypothetical protein
MGNILGLLLLWLPLQLHAETKVDTFGFTTTADNKWLVSGVFPEHNSLFLAKFSITGDLDSDFGMQTYPLSNENYFDHHSVAYPDNQVVLFSLYPKKTVQLQLRRILANSKPDLTFGKGGIADFEMETFPEEMKNSVYEANGKIFSIGCFPSKDSCKPSVSKVLQNGKRDTAFGKNGVVFLPEEFKLKSPKTAEVDLAGNLYISGQTFLLKLDSKAEPFKSFGNDGYADLKSFQNTGSALYIDSHQKIYFVGEVGEQIQVIKINKDGTIDKNFAKEGLLQVPTKIGKISTKKIFPTKDNQFVVGGNFENDKELGVFFIKFDQNGKLDKAFGKNGFQWLVLTKDTFYSRKLGLHLKSFQVNGLDIFQPSIGGHTLFPMISWNPYYQYSKNFSFYLNIGTFLGINASGPFLGLEYALLVGFHPHRSWVIKAGGGAQTWVNYSGTAPLIKSEVAWLLPKKFILDRFFVGYSYLINITPTHFISLGVGIEW